MENYNIRWGGRGRPRCYVLGCHLKYQIYQLLISAFELGDGAGDFEANAAVVSRLPQLEIYLHLLQLYQDKTTIVYHNKQSK